MEYPPPVGLYPQQHQYAIPQQQPWQAHYPQQASQQLYQAYPPPQPTYYPPPSQQFAQVQQSWYQAAPAESQAVQPPPEPQPPLPDEPPPLPPDEPPAEDPPLPSTPWSDLSLPSATPQGQQSGQQQPAAWHTPEHIAQPPGWPPAPWQQANYSSNQQYASHFHYPQPHPHQHSHPQQHTDIKATSAAVYQHPWQHQQQPHLSPAPLHQQQAPTSSPKSPTPPPINITSAADYFLPPGRSKRPRRMVLILRGLPGSGKTHIARKIRELEARHHADAPRIHGIDDYFVTEVEKEVLVEGSKGKRQRVTEMEYCFEPELEGRYKLSLFKAFKRTVEEGRFGMVIVDAPNAQVEDFKEYWTTGQRAGFEVFVLQPLDSNPQTCYERNTHGRTLQDISAMAAAWEAAPVAYPQLDFAPLLQSAPIPDQADIAEVEMDMEEGSAAGEDAGSEHAAASAAHKITSRWHQADGDAEQTPKAKKLKKKNAEALTSAPAIKQLKPILRTGSASNNQDKGVTWADESSSDVGFSIGGASRHQLATVYVLEGLGPPPADQGASNSASFADQEKKHRASEQQLFRNLLLGGSRS